MTLGEMVYQLFDLFDHEYGDRELSALATQMIVGDLIDPPRGRPRRAQARPRSRASRWARTAA